MDYTGEEAPVPVKPEVRKPIGKVEFRLAATASVVLAMFISGYVKKRIAETVIITPARQIQPDKDKEKGVPKKTQSTINNVAKSSLPVENRTTEQ